VHPFHGRAGTLRSLNRARVGALPVGLDEPDTLGKTGFQLATGWSLAQDLQSAAEALDLDPATPDWPRALDRILTAPHTLPAHHQRAESIACRFGRRLGCLLLALKLGASETRAARPEWHDEHWAFWAGLHRVVIGGGLLSGRLGELALPAAQAVLDAHGAADLRLTRSPFGAHLALVGLARCGPAPTTDRYVFDFGQTSIKRGIARYSDGRLARLELLPTLASVCPPLADIPLTQNDAARQWARMLAIVTDCVKAFETGSPVELGLCLACYLFDGHPAPDDVGCYGRLSLLALNLRDWMCAQLQDTLGRGVRLHLLHDGGAAALSDEGGRDSLVLTIGTALGSGFSDVSNGLTELARGFTLIPPRPL